MKGIVIKSMCAIAMCAVLVACNMEGKPTVSRWGEEAVDQLNQWYESNPPDCGTQRRPAFLCSGIIMRSPDPGFPSWVPGPLESSRESVSAAWLRTDSSFGKAPGVPGNHGMLFYPDFDMPEGDELPEILCSFPNEADSLNRHDLRGCGQHGDSPQSRPCDELGISSAEAWIANYTTSGASGHSHQCGWDLREGRPMTASRFYQSIRAQALLPDEPAVPNEIILAIWGINQYGSLPMHSFFYIANDNNGRNLARQDQGAYHQQFGKTLPVISLTLPTAAGGRARFAFHPEDQVVSPVP